MTYSLKLSTSTTALTQPASLPIVKSLPVFDDTSLGYTAAWLPIELPFTSIKGFYFYHSVAMSDWSNIGATGFNSASDKDSYDSPFPYRPNYILPYGNQLIVDYPAC